ncbi:AAA family ATPase [Candidatus Poribacteria bacterium]|nr:AAA family ATPase [Candidatus Poribacteria bacterium]MYK21271.1 AAA family ATPase [Candidatus Poribacteria bacterium]
MRLTRSQEAALNIEKHVCVTAGAGTGKTTVLVERYLKILREGNATPQEIVAITFTNKAAAEMKERVIKRLSPQEGVQDLKQSNSLQRFRDEMNSAHISTIHAFCASILREFPFQAGVPANFSIIQGIDQKLLLQKTLKETLRDIATNPDHPLRAELTRLLRRYGGQQKLIDFFANMINQHDVIEHLMQEIYSNSNDKEIHEALQQRIREQLMSTIDIPEFIRCLNTVMQVATGKSVKVVRDLTQQLETVYSENPNSAEAPELLKYIAVPITIKDGNIAKSAFIGTKTDTTDIDTEINFLVSAAKKIKILPETGDNETSDVETDDDFLLSTTHDLLTLYNQILNDYEKAKLSQGTLDNDDLQLKTRNLLRNNEQIRQKLVKRYQYFMVDEYQDTNELQYELVMLLTNNLNSAKLFIVGDPKQSIYGFRGSDVRVFKETKEKITAEDGLAISLTENFRSLRDPIGFVNYFFDRLMGDGSENEFEVQYEPLTQARQACANGEIKILLGTHENEAADEYKLIAQHIKNMKASVETLSVRGKNGQALERPIQYDDIAILIQSRRHLPDIEKALLTAGIPYLTTSGVGFYQRQEIYDIWNYLNFLSAPSKNDASLAGVLRGPAFGISDAELYEISLQKDGNFWEKTQNYKAKSSNLKRAIHTLNKHDQFAHRMPVNQLIVTIVNETGLIGTLKTGIYGQQRLANYQKLLELARNFDGDENTQILPDFIEFLDVLITEEPREGQAPVEACSGAVQIMTIHTAKGKEFPIVILPCLNRRGQTDSEPFIDEIFGIGFSPLKPDDGYRKTEPSIIAHMKNRSREKEVAEKKRLFYVGTTRAENRLILSGTLSEKGEAQEMLKWLDTHLGICDREDNLPRLPFKRNVSRQLEDCTSTDETFDDITPIEFPECLPSALEPTGISAAFSVTELANYARCPLRYQLENVLRIPTDDQRETGWDETEMDNAIRSTLARIRRQLDTENLDTIIDQALENYPEATTESTAALRTYVNNFTNSELGKTAFSAAKTYTNQQVHADIDGHIIDGRFDRLFQDKAGYWQVVIYKTGDLQDSEAYQPEMELYSLLAHRRYPEQPTVTINIFFTEQDHYIQKNFSIAELQETTEQWQKKISALQRGNYNKNTDHCCSCPYADPNGQCIITES